MRKSLELLRQLAPPPKKPLEVSETSDWNSLEQDLGLEFPPDYRDLVTTYGSGAFSYHNYGIEVGNPFAANRYRQLREIAHIRITNRSADPGMRYVNFPEKNGLFPWGYDGNGCMLLWRTGGPPSRWPTLTYAPDIDAGFYRFRMNATTFLARALSNQISVPIWSLPFTVPRRRVFKAYAFER